MAVQKYSGGNLKDLTKSGVTVVNFSATWCGPCQMLAPILEEMSSEQKIIKIDVDENQDLAKEFQVKAVPTTFIFKDGEVKDTVMGFIPGEVLKGKISQVQ